MIILSVFVFFFLVTVLVYPADCFLIFFVSPAYFFALSKVGSHVNNKNRIPKKIWEVSHEFENISKSTHISWNLLRGNVSSIWIPAVTTFRDVIFLLTI